MAGPVDRQVRELLGNGCGVTREQVRGLLGALGITIFDRLVKMGATESDSGGSVRLRQWRPDPVAVEAAAKRKAWLDAESVRIAAERAEAARRARENEARDREQRMLWANVDTYGSDERPIVIAERAAALRESRAILNATNG